MLAMYVLYVESEKHMIMCIGKEIHKCAIFIFLLRILVYFFLLHVSMYVSKCIIVSADGSCQD